MFYYALGAPVSPTSFAELTEEELGGGRLRAPYTATLAGTRVSPGNGLRDRQNDHWCMMLPFADGSVRCSIATLDMLFVLGTPYSDPECTNRLVFAGKEGDLVVFLSEEYDGCGELPSAEARLAGPAYKGDMVYLRHGAGFACGEAGPPTAAVHELGALVDPASVFAEVTIATE